MRAIGHGRGEKAASGRPAFAGPERMAALAAALRADVPDDLTIATMVRVDGEPLLWIDGFSDVARIAIEPGTGPDREAVTISCRARPGREAEFRDTFERLGLGYREDGDGPVGTDPFREPDDAIGAIVLDLFCMVTRLELRSP